MLRSGESPNRESGWTPPRSPNPISAHDLDHENRPFGQQQTAPETGAAALRRPPTALRAVRHGTSVHVRWTKVAATCLSKPRRPLAGSDTTVRAAHGAAISRVARTVCELRGDPGSPGQARAAREPNGEPSSGHTGQRGAWPSVRNMLLTCDLATASHSRRHKNPRSHRGGMTRLPKSRPGYFG